MTAKYSGIRPLAFRTLTFLLLVIFGANGVLASFTCVNTHPMFSGFTDTSFCSAEGIETEDFNNDGNLDLIGGMYTGGVCVALGDGMGGFGSPSTTSLGSVSGTRSIAVGDFNSDGNPDFAVAGGGTSNIAVGYGTGSGGFTSITYYTTNDVGAPDSPWGITTGDFDSDGDTDLATSNGSSFSVFQNIHGAFAKYNNVTVAGGGYGISAADFDTDGRIDLFLTQNGNPGTVVYNNAFGNSWTAYVPLGNSAIWFISSAAGDFDQDGNKDDLVSAGVGFGINSVQVLTGNTNRTMTSSQSTSILQYFGGGIRTGDFNADNKTDLALASGYQAPGSGNFANFIHYELNLGAGQFGDGTSINLGSNHTTSDIAVGDFDNNGKPEGALGAGSTAASVTINKYNINATRKTDYDGDGRSDYSVWRPSNGVWNNWYSYFNTQTYGGFGVSTDYPVPGDYDGDKKTDMAVFRPGNRTWYISYSSDSSTHYLQWGASGDYLTPADFDGDGKTDIAVWRPSNGVWYIYKSTNGATQYISFGLSGDQPVQADYDADGLADAAVFRPSDTTWYVFKSTTSSSIQAQWGLTTDNLVPGDYDGDCKNDFAVWRSSDQTWYILYTSNWSWTQVQHGNSTNIPQPADFDGDGKTDLAMWTASTGAWSVKTSSHGVLPLSWGASTDVPATSLFPLTNIIP